MPVESVEESRAWGEATARELIAIRLAQGGAAGDHPSALRWRRMVEQTLADEHPARVVSLLTALADLGVDGVEAGEWLPKRPRLPMRPPAAETIPSAELPATGAGRPAAAPPAGAPPRGRFATAARIGAALVVGLLLKTFVVQVYAIPSSSMEPTLNPGERLAVDKVSFRLAGIERGDMVVFRAPAPGLTPHDTLVKRVVALGGDEVEAVGGVLLVNGSVVHEPYLAPEATTLDFGPVVVPDGDLFVLGDHRLDSLDSRSFGSIDADLVIGRPLLRLWPLGDVGPL